MYDDPCVMKYLPLDALVGCWGGGTAGVSATIETLGYQLSQRLRIRLRLTF